MTGPGYGEQDSTAASGSTYCLGWQLKYLGTLGTCYPQVQMQVPTLSTSVSFLGIGAYLGIRSYPKLECYRFAFLMEKYYCNYYIYLLGR